MKTDELFKSSWFYWLRLVILLLIDYIDSEWCNSFRPGGYIDPIDKDWNTEQSMLVVLIVTDLLILNDLLILTDYLNWDRFYCSTLADSIDFSFEW